MVPAALILDMQSMEDAGGFLGQGDSWHIMPKPFTPGGPLETYVDRQGLRCSFRQRDGQDGYFVPNFIN